MACTHILNRIPISSVTECSRDEKDSLKVRVPRGRHQIALALWERPARATMMYSWLNFHLDIHRLKPDTDLSPTPPLSMNYSILIKWSAENLKGFITLIEVKKDQKNNVYLSITESAAPRLKPSISTPLSAPSPHRTLAWCKTHSMAITSRVYRSSELPS